MLSCGCHADRCLYLLSEVQRVPWEVGTAGLSPRDTRHVCTTCFLKRACVVFRRPSLGTELLAQPTGSSASSAGGGAAAAAALAAISRPPSALGAAGFLRGLQGTASSGGAAGAAGPGGEDAYGLGSASLSAFFNADIFLAAAATQQAAAAAAQQQQQQQQAAAAGAAGQQQQLPTAGGEALAVAKQEPMAT